MIPHIYFRIFGHAATLTLHGVNSAVMLHSLQDEIIMRDPEIKTLASMQGRFLTIWNIAFQLTYSSLALTCDLLTLTNREHLLPKFVKKFRDFFFSSVVFPGTFELPIEVKTYNSKYLGGVKGHSDGTKLYKILQLFTVSVALVLVPRGKRNSFIFLLSWYLEINAGLLELVFLIFWPFYLYDRNIIFPEYIDKVFSQKSNYVMHIAIVPVVLWELAFQPRNKPKDHRPYCAVLFLYYTIYNAFLFYTYHQRGLWPYPLMGMLYGTIYNVILYAYTIIVTCGVYYMQWPLQSLFWGQENKIREKSKMKIK